MDHFNQILSPESLDYRIILNSEFAQRQENKPGYSLRAFARDIETSPSHLSEVLSGKSNLSLKKAEEMASSLFLNTLDKTFFVNSAIWGNERLSKDKRKSAYNDMLSYLDRKNTTYTYDVEKFKIISQWYHLAILTALNLEHFDKTIKNLSDRLDLDYEDTVNACKRLEKMGFVKITDNYVTALENKTSTLDQSPSAAIRNFHNQVLKKAAMAVLEYNMNSRFNSSSYLTFPENRIEEVQEFLIKMREEFLQKFENHPDSDQVYMFNLNFFPILKKS